MTGEKTDSGALVRISNQSERARLGKARTAQTITGKTVLVERREVLAQLVLSHRGGRNAGFLGSVQTNRLQISETSRPLCAPPQRE